MHYLLLVINSFSIYQNLVTPASFQDFISEDVWLHKNFSFSKVKIKSAL